MKPTMTDIAKQKLIQIIQTKGDCVDIICYTTTSQGDINGCPFYIDDECACNDEHNPNKLYKQAVEKFIECFSEEELVEILL
jgi:hypothetical protein